MQLSFEHSKNIRAALYTFLICMGLVCLSFLLQWQQSAPVITPPAPEYMEVNLGNGEMGEGTVAPLSTEAPAPAVGETKIATASVKQKSIKIPSTANTENDEAITQKIQPKAVLGKYAGGNGGGGNNQDSYNQIKDQGIAGGKGDQGVANGSIKGNVYTGKGGPFVTKGDRQITKVYSFNGDVEPATIYADIEVSANGIGRFIQISKGSSSNDAKYKKAIIEYLTKIGFNSSDHVSMVTVKFKFDVNQ